MYIYVLLLYTELAVAIYRVSGSLLPPLPSISYSVYV